MNVEELRDLIRNRWLTGIRKGMIEVEVWEKRDPDQAIRELVLVEGLLLGLKSTLYSLKQAQSRASTVKKQRDLDGALV